MQKMQVKLGGSPSRVIQVLHELVHKPLYCKQYCVYKCSLRWMSTSVFI